MLAVAALGAGASEALADYPAEVLADSPDSYFRMNDTDATMVNRITTSPNGNHRNDPLLGVESPLVNDSADRSVGYREGSNPDRSEFVVGTINQFSLEFFVKTNQAVLPGVSNWYDGFGLVDGEISGVTSDTGTALVGGGKIGFGVGNPDITIKSTTTVNDFQWHHVVATSNSNGEMRLYVDGQLEAQTNTGPGGTRSNSSFTVGSLHTNILEFAGAIDEVAYYPHVLSATDVSQHYAARNDAPAPAKLTVYPSGGGRGDITGPGIDCIDINAFLSGGGDCEEVYAPGTQVTLTPHPAANSRFSEFTNQFAGIPGHSNNCEHITTCSFTAESGAADIISATFYLNGNALGSALHGDGVAADLDAAYGPSINPQKKKDIKLDDVNLTRFGGEQGTAGGVLATLISKSKVDLIGSDGATLVGNAGNTLTTKTPTDAAQLIGSDGASLIGSDGATLIGPDGATLIGSDGATRVIHDGGAPIHAKAPKPAEYKAFALANYRTQLTDTGDVQVTLSLSSKGRKIMKTLAQENLASKKTVFPLNTAFLEVIRPADGFGAGGSFDQVKIK